MEVVRFGLVGCGSLGATSDPKVASWPDAQNWLPYSHCGAITAASRARLVAVCDLNGAASEAARKSFAASRSFTDLSQMLETVELEALALATRTSGRCELLKLGVSKGIKAFYCEKPLSTTLEAADELLPLLENKIFLYGTKRRFMPIYQKARQLIRAGAVGKPESITAGLGMGGLLWTHPHSADLLAFFAEDAPPESVQSALEPITEERGRVDADPIVRHVHVRFANGISGHILASASYDVQVTGTRGVLTIYSNGARASLRVCPPDQLHYGLFTQETAVFAEGCAGTQRAIEVICEALLDSDQPDYNIGHAIRNQEILFGAVESHLQGGRVIKFPLRRRGLEITGKTGQLFP